LAYGFVDEQAHALGEVLVTLLGEQLQNGVQEFRLQRVVGQLVLPVAYFVDTPARNQAGPTPDPLPE
jgi:hypothetical protein